MAKFDVYRTRDTGALVVDCQSDLIDHFDTRFVVPLVPPGDSASPIPRLMPAFSVEGETMVLAPQFAGAVPKQVLGPPLASLARHDFEIGAALDMLISGY